MIGKGKTQQNQRLAYILQTRFHLGAAGRRRSVFEIEWFQGPISSLIDNHRFSYKLSHNKFVRILDASS